MSDSDQRWGIFIDIEGFSKLWSQDNLGLRALIHLTRLVFRIGDQAFPDVPERLFAHQGGDAFYVASDFHETSLDRCAAIAIVLLRGMLEEGFVARAALAAGSIADHASCRPPEVRAASVREDDSSLVRMGQGLMTLQSVLGEGIINAVGLDKRVKLKGSLAIVAESARERLSDGFIMRPVDGFPGVLALDWIHSVSPLIGDITRAIGFGGADPADLSDRLRAYVADHSRPEIWSGPTFRYAGLS
jgi:hypothetical protein